MALGEPYPWPQGPVFGPIPTDHCPRCEQKQREIEKLKSLCKEAADSLEIQDAKIEKLEALLRDGLYNESEIGGSHPLAVWKRRVLNAFPHLTRPTSPPSPLPPLPQ
jgi:hypothetical protein